MYLCLLLYNAMVLVAAMGRAPTAPVVSSVAATELSVAVDDTTAPRAVHRD